MQPKGEVRVYSSDFGRYWDRDALCDLKVIISRAINSTHSSASQQAIARRLVEHITELIKEGDAKKW